MTEKELKTELETHGRTCVCAHKKMCEDREEWLTSEIREIILKRRRALMPDYYKKLKDWLS